MVGIKKSFEMERKRMREGSREQENIKHRGAEVSVCEKHKNLEHEDLQNCVIFPVSHFSAAELHGYCYQLMLS